MLSARDRPSQYTMRGYGNIHGGGGGPGGEPSGGRGGIERKPSKLEQMRTDYQAKLMKEKEEKMVHMYEENQRKAMERIQGRQGSGGGGGGGGGGSTVRDFFNERRRLEKQGAAIPPIDNHFRQAKGHTSPGKGYNSPGGWSSRAGSGNSSKKTSAGRDRSQPLAPIRRPMDTQEAAHNARPGIPQRTQFNGQPSGIPQANGAPMKAHSQMNGQHASGIPQRQHANGPPSYGAPPRHDEENPFNGRSKLVKHKPLPPPSNGNNQNGNPAPPSQLPRQRKPQPPSQPQPPPQPRRQQQQQRQQPHDGGGEKLTDFQKWQLEQNQARENRLKKLNSNKPLNVYDNDDDEDGNGDDAADGYWGHSSNRDTHRSTANKSSIPAPVSSRSNKNVAPVSSRSRVDYSYEEENVNEDDAGDDVTEDGYKDEVAELERQLLEKIAREQAELERMRIVRKKEEEEEVKEAAKEAARLKKQEAAERARRKKLEEEERKEEERRRREEAEEKKRERQRQAKEDEKRGKEEEKFRKEEAKLTARRQKEDEKRQKEEERRRIAEEKKWREEEKKLARSQQGRKGNYYGEEEEEDYDEDGYDPPSPGRTYTVSKQSGSKNHAATPRRTEVDIDDMPATSRVGDSGADYYLKMAAQDPEAKGSVGSMAACKNCGRKFAKDRIQKHQNACKKVTKPRKEFDASKKRVEGTEMAKYQGKSKREVPKKKSNWRAKHEEFIENLRYAKKATEYEKQGKDIRELGPPPTHSNPDLVPCPHCSRTFNVTAAERHIPRCKDIKTRPPRMRR